MLCILKTGYIYLIIGKCMCCTHFNHCDCRIASLSKIFPTLMLYKLWEDGLVDSLDDPLEKYADNFTIKDPLRKTGGPASSSARNLGIQSPALTLRRMASQLSGKHTSLNVFHDLVAIFDKSTLKEQTSKNCVAWIESSEPPPTSHICSVNILPVEKH